MVLQTGGTDDLKGKVISMIGEAPGGWIWVGTRQGELLRLDPVTGQTEWLSGGSHAPVTTGGTVLSMAIAGDGEVWVGRANGVDVRSAQDGSLIRQVRRELRKPWGLAGNNVAALLRDQAGSLWVGSYGGGLQSYSPTPSLWVRRGEGPDDGVFAEGDVTSLLQLRNGEVWAGTNERGVAILDPELRLVAEIRPQPRPPGSSGQETFGGGRVSALAESPDGTVWVGTEARLHEFSPDRRLRQVHGVGQGRTRRLLATRDGGLWVGTQDGVYLRAPGSQEFVRLELQDGRPSSGNVNALVEAADGGVWVGGELGLHRWSRGGPRLSRMAAADAKLDNTVVLGLLLDRKQQLWVDTNSGLQRLVKAPGQPEHLEAVQANGSSGPASFGANLLADAQGRIWTHQGIYDPRDNSHYELTVADGVDIGTGWFRSYTQLHDGRLLFGGSTGILVAEPEGFKGWTYAPPLVVSELRINGERAPTALLDDGLKLQPGQRSLSIEFAALDFSQPARNRYRYRLAGMDQDWVSTGAEFRVASYGNLPPGRYTLEVQGSNRVGEWSPQQLRIPLQVLPAWWQTWWAWGLLALAVLLLLAWVVQLRTRLLSGRQRALEQKVQERTAELEALSLALQQKSRALEESSFTDPLTGLNNRRFLAQHIDADVAVVVRRHQEHLREQLPLNEDADLIFFLIDIDHFKQVNDRLGHSAGDALLMQMRGRLQRVFRQTDHLVRWGGEEFLIVARSTSRLHAADLAERARAAVADEAFVLEDGSLLRKTCSVGFACFPPAPEMPQALDWSAAIDIADAALYAVKHSGRNGWMGVVSATAASGQALQDDLALPWAAWVATGRLQLAGSSQVLLASAA